MSSSYNILSSNSLFSMSVFWPLIIPEVIQLKIKRSTCFARQSYFSNVPQICVSPVIILDEFLGLSVVAKKCCRHRQPGRLSPPPAAFQVNSVVTSIIGSTEYGQHFFFSEKGLSSKLILFKYLWQSKDCGRVPNISQFWYTTAACISTPKGA